ncbi:MAG: endonuclease, partial [Proteiniphilum sp.]|nr:endonuclease [Proteiniphilum sp.]
MHRILILVALLTMIPAVIVPQEQFRVMFYNVENLFDTRDDSLKNDNEFLPDGFMRWTPWKYWEKLRNITRVITAVGGMQSPALVGLCEVENDSVIFDLTHRSPLRTQEYAYLVSDSPDERGIDVALLYQRHQFRLLEHREYEVTFDKQGLRPTRNILHVVGNLVNGDTLDLFVCHFPSRSEGQRETEPQRVAAAQLLREKADSLLLLREDAHILIMGDFNDHPDNKSLSLTLQAKAMGIQTDKGDLYN